MAGCSTCGRWARLSRVTSEGPIVKAFEHPAEAMQAAALWNLVTRVREETEPHLGERSLIDPTRLCEQE